jgi:hypothetical protein
MTENYDASPEDRPDFVARHDVEWKPAEIAEQIGFLRSRIKNSIAGIQDRPQNLRRLSRAALQLAAFTHLQAPGAQEIWSYLRLSARACAADAARQSPGNGPVTADFGSGTVRLPRCEPYGDRDGVEVGDVCDAYHAAFATRDHQALDLLAECDMARLMRSPPQLAQQLISYPQALGMQTMLRGTAEDSKAGTQLLIDAMNGCNDRRLDPRITDYAIFTISPAIELALRHLHTDELSASHGWKPVNEVLRQALASHRHYWRDIPVDGQPQSNKPESLIALGPLAFAALRHDEGLPVTIRSDYLPQNIVDGQMPAAIAAGGLPLGDLG